MAFNCAPLSAVPTEIDAGAAHVIVGVAFSTVIATVAVAVVKAVGSVGVNVVDSVWLAPADSTVPAGGVYANVPGADEVAFSCVPSSAVP